MAQSTIADYFSTKKRAAIDESKIHGVRKVLILDKIEPGVPEIKGRSRESSPSIVYTPSPNISAKKKVRSIKNTPRSAKMKQLRSKAGDIQAMLNKMSQITGSSSLSGEVSFQKEKEELERKQQVTPPTTPTKRNASPTQQPSPSKKLPTFCKRINAMDKVGSIAGELSYNELRQKLSRSSRLADLKASISRFSKSAAKLDAAEKKTADVMTSSPKLKSFQTIELEVNLSPHKILSPEKSYLSPKKDMSVRKNLLNLLSPTKNAVPMPSSPKKNQLEASQKTSLTLPYKYRCLAEMFRAMDTITQIMHNRKETITFSKMKPAVEKLLKRTFTERHLAQIVHLYPQSYKLQQEKMREFGSGTQRNQWELVLTTQLEVPSLTSEVILHRRRKLFSALIEKVKDYHQEFLATFDPPMDLPRDKITRWHPQFDIEKVPDIELAIIPSPPTEHIMTTGQAVLEKAREMFNCNTRMERALDRLKEFQEKKNEITEDPKPIEPTSILKGIPKALLEKVRQKQAAKALETMTRTPSKIKQEELYSRLPEIARLTRNLFVAEKKGVLPLDAVLEKLACSFHTFLTGNDMEIHLRTIEKEVPGWLVFHKVRNSMFVKVSRDADVSIVMRKLERASQKIHDS